MGISFERTLTSLITVTRKKIESGKTTTDNVLISGVKCTSPISASKSFSTDSNGIVSGVKRFLEVFFELGIETDFRQSDKCYVDGIEYKLSYFEFGRFMGKYRYFFVLERSN